MFENDMRSNFSFRDFNNVPEVLFIINFLEKIEMVMIIMLVDKDERNNFVTFLVQGH